MLLCELLPPAPPPPPPLWPALAPVEALPRVSLNVRYRRKVVVVDVDIIIIELGELVLYLNVSLVELRPSKASSKSSLFLRNAHECHQTSNRS